MNTRSSNKPPPLGRGLSALFGDADAAYQARPVASAVATSGKNENGVRSLPIEWIQPGAFQPRRHFDESAIQELAASIKERGILQPLMVRPIEGEKDSFEIIAGERRWRAAQIAGIHEVPVLVRSLSDREAMEVGLIENVQRQDLSPLEEAEGYRRLIEEFHHKQDDLAKIVGKSRPYITNLLRLLGLPDTVKKMIADGSLTIGHARCIITAQDPELLAKEIVRKGLSVRKAEVLAQKLLEGKTARATNGGWDGSADIIALEKSLSLALGLKVKIAHKGRSGSMRIFYQTLTQFEVVLKKLRG